MSYDITIGEPEHEVHMEDEELWCLWGCTRVELDNAPQFDGDDLTGNSNCRSPGYTQWSEWCRVVGLYDLFFAERTGLMARHPGISRLRWDHYVTVANALAVWRTKHGDPPGWGEGQDPVLARLVWLEFWVKWALTTCKVPALVNS